MRVIAWLSLVVLIGSFLCRPIADPDLWWHIAVGRWIVAHREVPHVDYWNVFGVGQPWRAYSWSNEVVYALVESSYKETGLAVLQLMLGCVFTAAIFWSFGAIARDYFLGALMGVLAAVACRSHFSVRPQTVVWILFVLVLLIAEKSRQSKTTRWHLLSLLVLGSLWANTHISALFGVMGIVLWSFTGGLQSADRRRIATPVGCFIAGTFLSPYVGGEWLTLFAKSDHIFSFRGLDEFKPADLMQVPTMCLLFQIVLITVLSFASNRLPPLGAMMVAVCAVIGGALAVKFVPFASIAVGAVTAVWLGERAADRDRRDGDNPLLEAFLLVRAKLMALHPQTVGACAFFIGCIAWVNIAKAIKVPIDYSTIPAQAVDFIEKHNLQHPVLNEFSSGGYLEYRWSSPQGEPTHLVPLDGRTNVNRRDVWDSYTKSFRGSEQWREYFAKVNPRTVIWRQGSPLVALLLEAQDWCRVFESSKRSSSYAVFITREEFDRRRGEFTSSDCSYFVQSTNASRPACKDLCGDGTCQEIVCMAIGCPCAESPERCPSDCKREAEGPPGKN